METTELQKQLADWQEVYQREMAIVLEEGATQQYNSGEAMSAHLKSANLASQNIVRLEKLLRDCGDEREDSPLEQFLSANATN